MTWTRKIVNIFTGLFRPDRKRRQYQRLADQVDRILTDRRTGTAIEQFTYWPLYESPEYGTPCGDLWYNYTTWALMKNYELEYFASAWRNDDQQIEAQRQAFVSQCVTIA